MINGLTDVEHPCQALGDLFTLQERLGDLRGGKLAYVGDGNNNVTHSLMDGAAKTGLSLCIACPADAAYAPDPAVLWVSSTRAGEIPGTHEVALEGPADSIVLAHVARGREGFASGAVAAAEWVSGRKGFFGIDEMLAERFGQS